MSQRKHWHLVAYDIRCPRRLRRVQKLVARNGQGLQQSVYMVRANPRELGRLLDEIAGEMDPDHDDLRAYPVPHPAQLWCGGAMALEAHGQEAVSAEDRLAVWGKWLGEQVQKWRKAA